MWGIAFLSPRRQTKGPLRTNVEDMVKFGVLVVLYSRIASTCPFPSWDAFRPRVPPPPLRFPPLPAKNSVVLRRPPGGHVDVLASPSNALARRLPLRCPRPAPTPSPPAPCPRPPRPPFPFPDLNATTTNTTRESYPPPLLGHRPGSGCAHPSGGASGPVCRSVLLLDSVDLLGCRRPVPHSHRVSPIREYVRPTLTHRAGP